MHDGRFATLEDVIEHYSTGIKLHPNLDGRLATRSAVRRLDRQARGCQFSTSEKAALLAFLKTLSDPKFITDPKFSDPFETK